MARRKAKVYSRFDVATYMQEKKRLREDIALAHKTLAKKKSKLDRLIYRVSCKIRIHFFQLLGGDKQGNFDASWKVFTSIYRAQYVQKFTLLPRFK